MKVLLLIPGGYTLAQTFRLGFEQNGCEVLNYDYRIDVSNLGQRVQGHVGKLPYSLRAKWYSSHVRKINARHMSGFHSFQPDLVLVYNSELLLPDTVQAMKRSAKVCFFLGDSPFYTPQNDFYLPCLALADHVLCPDSYWEKQLRGMGLASVHYFLMGSNTEVNYNKQVTAEEQDKWGSDLVFIGISYNTAVGYKRALFLSQFADLDIRIYTSRGFRRWYGQFPELEKRVVHPERRLTDAEVNTVLNCCKVYPVDANPGLINGIHLRVFDCIASGILPLAEYRKDLNNTFDAFGLPLIKEYGQAASMAEYYLKNESERKEIVSNLQAEVDHSYSPEHVIGEMLRKVAHD